MSNIEGANKNMSLIIVSLEYYCSSQSTLTTSASYPTSVKSIRLTTVPTVFPVGPIPDIIIPAN